MLSSVKFLNSLGWGPSALRHSSHPRRDDVVGRERKGERRGKKEGEEKERHKKKKDGERELCSKCL